MLQFNSKKAAQIFIDPEKAHYFEKLAFSLIRL